MRKFTRLVLGLYLATLGVVKSPCYLAEVAPEIPTSPREWNPLRTLQFMSRKRKEKTRLCRRKSANDRWRYNKRALHNIQRTGVIYELPWQDEDPSVVEQRRKNRETSDLGSRHICTQWERGGGAEELCLYRQVGEGEKRSNCATRFKSLTRKCKADKWNPRLLSFSTPGLRKPVSRFRTNSVSRFANTNGCQIDQRPKQEKNRQTQEKQAAAATAAQKQVRI